MTGGDDFSDINVIIAGAVYIAGTQTITGDKTFSGTTVMDGALEMNGITSNTNTLNNTGLILNNNDIENQGTIVNTALGLITNAGIITNNGNINNEGVITLAVGSTIDTDGKTITPAEVGYLDGVVSDIQPQINARALDSAVVHILGAETITGGKIFKNDTFTLQNGAGTTRLSTTSTNVNITGVVGITGATTITAGTGTNTISAVGVGGINVINGESNRIQYNGTNRITTSSAGVNLTGIVGITGDTTITGLVSATAGTKTNLLSAVGVGGINTITGETNQIQYNGTNRITTGATAVNITGVVGITGDTTITGLVSATAGTKTNTLSAVGVGGKNIITGETNQIQYNGTDRINIGSTTTTMNNSTTNIQSGGSTKIQTTASSNYFDNTNTRIQSGTVDKINVNGTDTAMTNTTSLTTTHPTTTINASVALNINADTLHTGSLTVNNDYLSVNDITGLGNDLITNGLNYLFAGDTNIISSGTSDFNASSTILQSNNDTTILAGTDLTLRANGGGAGIGDIFLRGDVYNTSANDTNVSYNSANGYNYLTTQRRSYIMDFTVGTALNTEAYPFEVKYNKDDPAYPTLTGASTYIEITMIADSAGATFNHEIFSGNFISGGNSDIPSLFDSKIGLYTQAEQHVLSVNSGGTANNTYRSFVVYVRAGYAYRIITDGVIGNYFKYQAPTTIPFRPAYRYWSYGGASATGASITYTADGLTTFAIVKTFSTNADVLGATANTGTVYNKNSTNSVNINGANTATKIAISQSNCRQIHQEYYIASLNTTSPTIIPLVNVMLYGTQQVNSGTGVQVVFTPNFDGSSANNPNLKMMFPFRVRCVGFTVMIDNDLSTTSPVMNFRLRLSNALGVPVSTYYDDVYQFPSGGFTNGGAGAVASYDNNSTISALNDFYAYANYTNSSGVAYTLASEWTCIFYFQQVLT